MSASAPRETVIGVLGNVDSGKSSTVGVLITGELDDGRGLARSKISAFAHELRTGRTSSVSSNFLKLPDDNLVEFIDLPGHRRYLKSALHGISGRCIDYVMILVGANMGVSAQTKEHFELALSYRIPILVLVTKVDIAPPEILKETVDAIKLLIKKSGAKQNVINLYPDEMSQEQVTTEATRLNQQSNHRFCPVIYTSNTTGLNLMSLKGLVSALTPRLKYEYPGIEKLFSVARKYRVPGIGLVLTGRVLKNSVARGEKLFFGPYQGEWLQLVVKDIHNNFRERVDSLAEGCSGCLAVQLVDKTKKLVRNKLNKGTVVVMGDNNMAPKLVSEFVAQIYVRKTNSNTITTKYEPIINCRTVRQAAKMVEIRKADDETGILRGGEQATVRFRFAYRPEYVVPNDRFIFSEGNVKGVGKIVEVC